MKFLKFCDVFLFIESSTSKVSKTLSFIKIHPLALKQRPARVESSLELNKIFFESSLRFFLCSFLISFVKKPNSTRLDSKNLELDSSRNEFESRCRSLLWRYHRLNIKKRVKLNIKAIWNLVDFTRCLELNWRYLQI